MAIFPSLDEITTIKTSGLYAFGDHAAIQEGIPVPSNPWLADLVRVPIDYILEIWDNGRLVTATCLPQAPNSVKVKRQHATKLSYTFGVEPVRQHALNRRLDLEFRGSTGVAERQGYSRNGKLITKDGFSLCLEFDAFLDKFQQIATSSGAFKYNHPDMIVSDADDSGFGGAGAYLVMRCLKEQIHVKVEPGVFDYDRDAKRSRLGADWSLTATAYAPAVPRKPQGLFGGLQKYLDAATTWINSVNNLIAFGQQGINSLQSGLQAIRAPFQALVDTSASLRNIISTGLSLADVPVALLTDCKIIAAQLAATVEETKLKAKAIELAYGAEYPTSTFEFLGLLQDETVIITNNANVMYGAAGLGPDTEAAILDKDVLESGSGLLDTKLYNPNEETATSSENGDAGDVVQYTVTSGQSADDIAKKVYGNGHKFGLQQIIQYNGLQDPFTWASGAPLLPGDILLLPNTGLSKGGMVKSKDINGMYGRDLLLDPATGDLVVTEDGFDVETVTGPDNLEQALYYRCRTPVGTSKVFPLYGIPVEPGRNLSQSEFGYVGAHLNEQLLRDRRVASVQNLALLDNGDKLGVRFDAYAEIGVKLEGLSAPIA